MKNRIQIPSYLLNQLDFALRISEYNEKIYYHINFLREFVSAIHTLHSKFCKKMLKIADQHLREVTRDQKNANNYVMNFIYAIGLIHTNLSQQVNRNLIALSTKQHIIAKNRQEILHQKLYKIDSNIKIFITAVDQYNSLEQQFRLKGSYFIEYEREPFKFYSLRTNNQLYQELKEREQSLRQKLQHIFTLKSQLKVAVSEVRIQMKDLFEIQHNMLTEYSRHVLSIRKSKSEEAKSKIVSTIQEQRSSKQQSSRISGADCPGGQFETIFSQIKREYLLSEEKQDLLERFFEKIKVEVASVGSSINQLIQNRDYQKFIKRKMLIIEILPTESIQMTDQILGQVYLQRKIFINILNFFDQARVLKELRKCRKQNYLKFSLDTEDVSKSIGSKEEIIFQKPLLKFEERNKEFSTKYQENLSELQATIQKEYHSFPSLKNKKISRGNIFNNKYYDVTLSEFFLSSDDNMHFLPDPNLRKYSQVRNAYKFQQQIFEQRPRVIPKWNLGCCGIKFGSKSLDDECIDEFNCALKDGIVLIQGKLTIYKQFFRFKSSFNSNTFFGPTYLQVPRWDIIQIIQGKYCMVSPLLTIVTTHGKIEFTSFINDPHQRFISIYDQKAQRRTSLAIKEKQSYELQRLEGLFQRRLHSLFLQKHLKIDKLNTYLTEDTSSLSILIHYHFSGQPQPMYVFEIKLAQKESSMEYWFAHSGSCKQNLRESLQQIAKEIINTKENADQSEQKIPALDPENVSLILSCSMIKNEKEQNHQISFFKDNSFLQKQVSETLLKSNELLKQSLNLCGQNTIKKATSIFSKQLPGLDDVPYRPLQSLQSEPVQTKVPRYFKKSIKQTAKKQISIQSKKPKPPNYQTLLLFLIGILILNLFLCPSK